MTVEKNYRWGKKRNEDVPHREKRRTILKGLREEEDLKEYNRRLAWDTLWKRRRPRSKAQITAGARKIL